MHKLIRRFLSHLSGATAIEYSLTAGFIRGVLTTVLDIFGIKLNAKFGRVSSGSN